MIWVFNLVAAYLHTLEAVSLHIHVWTLLWSNTDTVSNPSTHAIENTKLQEAIDDSTSNAHAL